MGPFPSREAAAGESRLGKGFGPLLETFLGEVSRFRRDERRRTPALTGFELALFLAQFGWYRGHARPNGDRYALILF
ncbi:hypothetical protein D7X94_07595 [Acutalibacter sp. 1XD8-33]|nr:hypothetical protein D7X94_07595 [Acutalibacter sp. 1XD8-33]